LVKNKGPLSGLLLVLYYSLKNIQKIISIKSYLILPKIIFLKKIKPSFIPLICWFIISTILLTIPGSAFPQENWLGKIWFDKWVHIGMFAIMTFLGCWAIHKKHTVAGKLRAAFMWIGLTCLVYGIGMEFVQLHFITNRSFDNGDIVADVIGCTVGVLYSTKRYIKN
jgi:VanZ family protein